MATVVSFHAHPDDESIQTGGTLAKLAAVGHRTVLVFATKGEQGEVDDGFLDDDEALWQRREKETAASAAILGVQRVEYLGYEDSGMMGTPENDRPESFWQADVEEAAERLATILREERADVLTAYDSDGGYGHPDHIQVHRVGQRAAELAGTPRFFEATMNRDHLRRMIEAQRAVAAAEREIDPDDVPDVSESSTFGRPESVITTTVDVSDFVEQKRRSMLVHASQIGDEHFFATMPDDVFAVSFGQEWFIRHGVPGGHRDDDLLAGPRVTDEELGAEPLSDWSRQASWTHTALAQQLVFGPGARRRLPEVVRATGARRAMLVTTAGRGASEAGSELVRALGRNLASTFSEVESHVPTTLVRAAVGQARSDDVDLVVSFGGGSCADLGKAVCFFMEQEAGAPGSTHLDRPLVPHVSIPTTYSGAELTPFFGMTDPATRQKQGAGGPTTAPVVAIYDPELTLSTPPKVSAETGMNALAHCVEAAWSPHRTPEAEAIALAGAATIHRSLPTVVQQPDDLDARTAMLEGAALAGRCLLNASMGVHHGLSQLVGGRTGIPHGLANAIILSHAVRFNADATPDAVRRIGAALGDPGDAAGAIERFRDSLGLPGSLSEVGVQDEDLEAVARLSQSNQNVARNARPVSEADALAILEAAW